MMNKNDLLYEYFIKQKEILSLLEESNNIVLELIKDDRRCNNILDDDYVIEEDDGDHWYMFKYHDSRNRHKYIQFDDDKYWTLNKLDGVIVKANPTITTKTGYRAGRNVIFKTKKEAKEFFKKFMTSKSRRNVNEYEMEAWKIVEVPKRVFAHQPLVRYFNSEYGWFIV